MPRFHDGNPTTASSSGEGLLPGSADAGPRGRDPSASSRASGFTPQDEDYTPTGLFMDAHGDFMLQHERYDPMAKIDLLWQPDSHIRHESGSFDLIFPDADVKVPLAVDPDNFVTVGGYVGMRSYDTSATFASSDENLYQLGVYLGAGSFVNEDVLIEGLFYPGIYSDLDGTLHHDDYQWYVDLLGEFRAQEDLFWKIGVSHNGLFEDLEVYPLLGVSCVIDSQWRLDVLLPRSLEVSYALNPSTILTAALTLDGNQYQVHNVSVPGNGRASHVQDLRLGFGAIYRFSDRVSMFGELGSTLAGQNELSNGNGAFSNGTLEPGFFLDLGVGLDF